jgi:ABC-2 type transport system ATP-binding protein
MERMLEIEGLTKRFGTLTAVDGISFTVNRGEVLGFLGPNGAGKTTAMRMVTGFLLPTAGRATVCGFDVIRDSIEVKRRIGYLPEGAPLYEDMTPLELLSFVADVRGLDGAERREAIARSAARINIENVMHQTIGTLSKGFKRRVGIAMAILHDPEVLILDEPTDGLDPNQKHEVRKLINEMAKDKAIVISTHLLEEVEMVCTRAIVIANGRIVADGTPADLEARSPYHNAVRVHLPREHLDACRTQLEAIDGVARVEIVDEMKGIAIVIALPTGGRVIIDVVSSQIRASEFPIEEIRVERGRLDEVFRQITTGG